MFTTHHELSDIKQTSLKDIAPADIAQRSIKSSSGSPHLSPSDNLEPEVTPHEPTLHRSVSALSVTRLHAEGGITETGDELQNVRTSVSSLAIDDSGDSDPGDDGGGAHVVTPPLPSVPDMLAKIEVSVHHPEPRRETGFIHTLDIWRATTTAADDAVRANPDVREGFDGIRDILDYMGAVFDTVKDTLPKGARHTIEGDLRAAAEYLRNMQQDSSKTSRAAMLLPNRVISNFLLLFAPIVENQKKTVGLYVGSTSKSTGRTVGLGLRKTTHAPQFWDHFIGRDLINNWQGVVFGVGAGYEFLKPGQLKEKWRSIAHHPVLSSVVGVGSVATAAMAFHGGDARGLLNKVLFGDWAPQLKGAKPGSFGATAVQRAGELRDAVLQRDLHAVWSILATRDWRRDSPPIEMTPEVRQALQHIADVAKVVSGRASTEPNRSKAGVAHLRDEMEKEIGEVSDSTNWTMGKLEGAFDVLCQHLSTVVADPALPARANVDWAPKVLILAVTIGALLGPIPFFLQGNKIGLVDLAANASFVILLQAMITGLPGTMGGGSPRNLREATDNAGSQAGFSLAMLPVWGVNKALGDPMEREWKYMLIGAAALVLIGNTLTSPMSVYLGKGVKRLVGAEEPVLDTVQIRGLPEDLDDAALRQALAARRGADEAEGDPR